MIMKEPIFWEYLIFDDECNIKGIQLNAPEDVKAEYQAWLIQQENDKQKAIKN